MSSPIRPCLTLLAAAALGACGTPSSPGPGRPVGPATVVPAPIARVEYVGAAPSPPRFEQPGTPPVAGQIWIGGYWNWVGGRHEWVSGHWESPRPGHYWVPYRWQQRGQQWSLHGGYWQRQ